MSLPDTARVLPYYPRLDGLRAVAVMAVFAEHLTFNDFIKGWAPGMVGVRTFFVLSGFLITSILLNQRGTDTNAALAVRFFARRFVRLAPAFYLAVAVTAALGIANMRSDWLVHVIYMSNFMLFQQRDWEGAGHFWTLAVEEQFYLLWFPIVVIAARRWLLPIIVTCIIASVLFRLPIAFGKTPFIGLLLPAQIDSLAMGALVAVAMRTPSLDRVNRVLDDGRLLVALLCLSALTFAPFLHMGGEKPILLRWVVGPLLVAVTAAFVIRRCVTADSATLTWLAHPVLVHLGKISYGLYVFHYFVPYVWYEYVPMAEVLDAPWLNILRGTLWVAVSVLLAEASWRWVEHPLMRRRQRLWAGSS